MSLEFSRRSFLKYTAVAAVAVAGAGIFTGCNDTNQPTGGIGSTLTPMSMCNTKLTNPAYSNNTFTCKVYIENISANELSVKAENFAIDVISKDGKTTTTYVSYQTQNNGVSLTSAQPTLKKDKDMTTTLTCTNISIPDGATVQVKYIPRVQASEGMLGYTSIFVTWKMTYDASKNAFK